MKKKLMRFNLAALALVMVTSVLISGTFAKYTTAVSGQDTALIAKWNISSTGMDAVTVDEDGKEVIKEMDLFSHSYDQAILKQVGEDFILGPGVEDTFEVNLTGQSDVDAIIDLKIAKTTGSVNAPIQYAVHTGAEAFNWNDATIYYSEHLLAEAILNAMVDDSMVVKNELSGDEAKEVAVKETNTAGNRPVILKQSDTEVSKTVTVHWRWPFDVAAHENYVDDMQKAGILTGDAWTDEMDTELGTTSASGAARTEYGLTLTLKADQVTPTTEVVAP